MLASRQVLSDWNLQLAKYFSRELAPKLGPVFNQKVQGENSSFVILCQAQVGSVPLFFDWFKNGQSIKSNHKYQIDYSKKYSTLNIEKMSREDAGNYTCKVKNAHGSDSLNVQLNVKGKFCFLRPYSSQVYHCNNWWRNLCR